MATIIFTYIIIHAQSYLNPESSLGGTMERVGRLWENHKNLMML